MQDDSVAEPENAGGEMPASEAVRRQLAVILASKWFAEAPRSRQFLTYVVENCLKGDTEALKESVIALEVFGKADFDPQIDSLVRGAARRLRKNLRRFYEAGGNSSPVLIDLPEGHYVPTFTNQRVQLVEKRELPEYHLRRRFVFWLAVATALLALALVIGFASWTVPHSRDHPRYPTRLLSSATSVGRKPIFCDTYHEVGHLLLTPDGKKLYAFEHSGKNVTVFDTGTLKIERVLALPKDVNRAAVSSDGRYIYAASIVDGVIVVDAKADRVLRVIPTGGPVMDVALTKDDQRAFLAMRFKGLWEADLKTDRLRVISEYVSPMYVTVNPAGNLVYVSYVSGGPGGRPGHDAVVAYDVKNGTVVHSIHEIPRVGGPILFRPSGDLAIMDGGDACWTPKYDHIGCPYVPSHVYEFLWPRENNRVEVVALPRGPDRGAITSDGTRYVYSGSNVSVFDIARRTISERFDPGRSTNGLAITPNMDRVFATVLGVRGMYVFESEVQDCQTNELGLENLFTGDGTTADTVGAGTAFAESSAAFAPGIVGQAFRFTGKPEGFLRIPYKSACPMCSEEWTISLYVQFLLSGQNETILKRVPDGRPQFSLSRLRDDRIALRIDHSRASVPPIVSRSAAGPGKWRRVHLVYDGKSVMLYIDGKLESQGPISFAIPLAEKAIWGDVYIGGSPDEPDGAPLNGLIDEIGFYSRALSASEIEASYNAWVTGNCPAK